MKSEIIEKDGKKFVRVGDLTIDPNNKNTYNNKKKEKLNQVALRTSFKSRKVRGLHIQEQPLMVRKSDMTVIVGNSRALGAEDEFGPNELMWIEWHEQKGKTSRLQEIRDRAGSNIFRPHDWNEKYNILNEFRNAYLSEMGMDMETREFKRLCKEWSTTPESYRLCKEIVDIQGDTQDLIDLDNKESKYGSSLQEVWKTITNWSSKELDPNPNPIDFADVLTKEKPAISKKAVDDLKKELGFIRGRTLSNKKRKQPVSLIFDSRLGWEKGMFSGLVSNIAQSCFANAFEEEYNVQTPIGKEGDADIIFPDFNVPHCEKVKIELKSSSIEDGKIRGNMRARQMKKNWHIFVLHQAECTRLAIMMVPVDGEIWTPASGNEKKCETTYQTIIENHEKDITFLMGGYFIDNRGDIQIEYEKF